jgi:phage recombination protein Bet
VGGLAEAPQARRWTREEIDLIKRTVVPQGATDAEFKLLLYQAARTGLDPLSGQIRLVKRPDGQGGQACTIQTGIDGFRLVSERTGRYAGMKGPLWCGPDGDWRDVWLDEGHPAAAKVGILRSDFQEPVWGVALWNEYVQTTKEGRVTRFWDRMGALMLAKCAEALARRLAFPQDLSGIYTHEEMAQADSDGAIDTTAQAPGSRRTAPVGRGAKANGDPESVTRAEVLKALGGEVKRLGLSQEQASQVCAKLFKGAKSARDLANAQVGALTDILSRVPDGTEDVFGALFPGDSA